MADSLGSLLHQSRQYAGEYDGGLSSHLTMGLVAMAGLGAQVEDLQRFYHQYVVRLPVRSRRSGGLKRTDWAARLGARDSHDRLASFFRGEVMGMGRGGALCEYVPILLPGIVSCGFHGLIRTAYGILASDDGEIAEGLALWANGYRRLAPNVEPAARLPLDGVLKAIREQRTALASSSPALPIARAIEEIDAHSQFHEFASSIEGEGLSIGSLAYMAARIYLSRQDFSLLHLVTATHALRTIAPFLSGPSPLLDFWKGFAAVYVHAGAPQIVNEAASNALESSKSISWAEIHALALETLDDHKIKLVYACTEEARMYKKPIYKILAAREVGIV